MWEKKPASLTPGMILAKPLAILQSPYLSSQESAENLDTIPVTFNIGLGSTGVVFTLLQVLLCPKELEVRVKLAESYLVCSQELFFLKVTTTSGITSAVEEQGEIEV